jgi:hypothetical protein
MRYDAIAVDIFAANRVLERSILAGLQIEARVAS